MAHTIRQALIDRLPVLSVIFGGHYPDVPTSLWEFQMFRNREAYLAWEQPDATVWCLRDNGRWYVVLESDAQTQSIKCGGFKDALKTAYFQMCAFTDDGEFDPREFARADHSSVERFQ